MATIDLGKLGFVNKGTYSSSTSYEKNDLVQYTDSGILSTYLYINASAATGQTPSTSGTVNGTYWAYYAKGGSTYTSTLTTQGDILYHNGSGEARLAAGTSGQFLKTQGSGANPVWADNTSDFVKIASTKVTGSSTSTINFDQAITSDYRIYFVTGCYKSDGSTPYLRMRFRTGASGSESSYSSNNYRYINDAFHDSTASARGNGQDSGAGSFDIDNDAGDNIWNNFQIYFYLPNSGSAESTNSWNGTSFQQRDRGSMFFVNTLGGYLNASINPTGITLFTSAGSFVANTNFKLFGIKE